MRRLFAGTAIAATLGALGLTVTAQAQPRSAAAPAGLQESAREAVVVGVPGAFVIKAPSAASLCIMRGPPREWPPFGVTAVPGGVNDCTYLIDGVWPHAGTYKFPITITAGGTTTIVDLTVDVAAAPAQDDPVGVGSDTIGPLADQLADNYDSTLSSAAPHEYSWDAVNPVTGGIGDAIAEKAGCLDITRPDGSSAGITQLATFTETSDGSYYCTNFARSSRARASTDPPYAAGGVAFAALARDAVTWSHPAVNTAAPRSLTVAQLNAIYTCSVTNWDQVGGGNQAIAPYLPQSGSGTLSSFLAAIGVTTPGPCVSNDNNTLEENEGVNPVLNNPGAIWIYSVGDYIAQSEHSDKCLKSTCAANGSGVVCKHTPTLIWFGCDVHGTERLGEITGVAPIIGSGTAERINPAFPATFDRTLYDVVPYDPDTTDHIPGPESGTVGGADLERIFGASGYDCASTAAKTDIAAYGFENIAACGTTS